MLHDVWMTYSTLSQLTPREQCQTHCSNSNPNPYPLPNHYLAYIVHHKSYSKCLVVHVILVSARRQFNYRTDVSLQPSVYAY